MWAISAALIVAVNPQAALAAGPINLGRAVFNVLDFGADPTGMTDSGAAITAAFNDCTGSVGLASGTAGCELYFPAGMYSVNPGTAGPFTLPAYIPITISGDGQRVSTLLVTGAADLFLGAGLTGHAFASDGFTAHDIGFVHASGSAMCATFCADIHLPNAQNATLYNLYFSSAYTPIELGRTIGSGGAVGTTNISSITSTNTFGCLFRLDGGNGTTHIVGITADGGHNVGSQVLCLPSADALSGAQFGTGTLRFADSRFTAFGRGISVTGYSLQFINNYFDDIVVDMAEAGPAFELFTPPPPPTSPPSLALPPSVIQDIRISNSRLVSASTACVLHGNVSLIKLVNDICIGAQPAPLPAACVGPPSQRGFVLAEVTGSGVSGDTMTLTILVGSTPITVTYTETGGETPQTMASALGQLINSSLAVNGSCPALIPVEQFSDSLYGSAPITGYSIGGDIEVYSYAWGSLTPAFSVTSTPLGATLSLPGTVSTPSPADGAYIGSPTNVAPVGPSDVTLDQTAAYGATNGSGLHLQGGTAMLLTRSRFGDSIKQNASGVRVDDSGFAYSDTQIQGNNLTGNIGQPLYFSGAGASPGANLSISNNAGYDPVGLETSPTMMCATALINPFSTRQQIYVVGAFSAIKKDNSPAFGAGSSAAITLGVNESIRIDCVGMMPPQLYWYGV
jgi:hypothetical protein